MYSRSVRSCRTSLLPKPRVGLTLGVSFSRMVALLDAGYLMSDRPTVLDIGCSNIHSVDLEALQRFLTERLGAEKAAALKKWSRFVAAGAIMDPEIGGTNGAWLGDVLERVGCDYTAFDIFEGYKTEFFDLNSGDLQERHIGHFDLVLNFGTTEHVLGQFNAFKIIHEAAAVGGLICHDLPMTGHLDHGFFNYNPMLLVDLAEANGYEILKLSFSGALSGESIARDFQRRYGDRSYLSFEQAASDPWQTAELPTASVALIARKLRDGPFRASLETSTTVGAVADTLDGQYGVAGANRLDLQREAKARVAALLQRLFDPEVSMGELNHAYNLFVESGLTQGFPLSLERRMLDRALEESPDATLAARRGVVEDLLRSQRPLLKVAQNGTAAAPGSLTFDGVEANFDLSGDEAAVFSRIVGAYGAYAERSAVELFPAGLEAIALERLVRLGPRDPDVLIRAGHVMAEVTPRLTPVT